MEYDDDIAAMPLSETEVSKYGKFFEEEPASKIFAVDAMLKEFASCPEETANNLTAISRFRIRVIWMVARLVYEAPLFSQARRRRLDAYKALFGPNHPKRLNATAKVAMEACNKAIA